MTQPRVFDTFPFNGELELLECRLTELDGAVDGFVLVESTVDHQDHDKSLVYEANKERFARWADRIVHVVAGREVAYVVHPVYGKLGIHGMPTLADDDGSWAREHAQREWIHVGLEQFGAQADDVILQSDVDEIPTAVAARNVRPRGEQMVSFAQKGHFWAVDWFYPPGWRGTVAARYGCVGSMARMRDVRNMAPPVPNAGWHFSWLGGREAAQRKVHSFCHPEVEDRILVDPDRFWRDGVHVDGVKMTPVDVDRTWPKWMLVPGNVPESWFRPR